MGLQTGIEIIPEPPFVIPFILPVMALPLSVSTLERPISLKNHAHEIADLPSLGLSGQQLLGASMAAHGHIIEGISVATEGGIKISTVELFPPPLG